MNTPFYLPRKLIANNSEIYTEAEILQVSPYVIILAEPGGGKTELLKSIAKMLNTKVLTANVFSNMPPANENMPLVIDGFDELAKIDQAGIYKILGKASQSNPSCLVMSSRSSEWDAASTNAFNQVFSEKPLLEVSLQAFDEEEQRLIFENYTDNENFLAFKTEVERFNLDVLLANPKFLQVFTDAYLESDKCFNNKNSIFEKAIERLAKEHNAGAPSSATSLPAAKKINIAFEVFAKLLLSGSEGVSTSEATETRFYPNLMSLNSDSHVKEILNSRLFKLGDGANQHRYVHKIIAEYGAAKYLTKRIVEPRDPLTLSKCLSIIAPNSTVRDELKGLLGWIATLGDQATQEEIIKLDAYAILANGDPSQLGNASKLKLVDQLQKLAEHNPFFRGRDFRRSFSTLDFFNSDVLEIIKPILIMESNFHLKSLLLEMLKDNSACDQLSLELRQILLSSAEDKYIRGLAADCLIHIQAPQLRIDLNTLVDDECSESSLRIAAKIIQKLNLEVSEFSFLAHYLKACTKLYPTKEETLKERIIGSRYFVRSFISALHHQSIEPLLEELTSDLSCVCGKLYYECDCRNGISKIVGVLLDRYFTQPDSQYDAFKIWSWVKGLHFHGSKTAKESPSVRVLQENLILRQNIIKIAFDGLTARDQIQSLISNTFNMLYCHSGLILYAEDRKFIVDLAFELDNPALWSCFIATHSFYSRSGDRGPDAFRRHMREQAKSKSAFMREWILSNRANRQLNQRTIDNSRRSRRNGRKHQAQQNDIKAQNLKYLKENRSLVESGKDFYFLQIFSAYVLLKPEKIQQAFGDEELVHHSLINCLDFIAPDIPNLQEFAELQCQSQTLYVEQILYAACVLILRDEGNLEQVSHNLLLALRTDLSVHYTAVSDEERSLLKAEVDRLLFTEETDAENFIRDYIEPQLARFFCPHPELFLLNDDVFKHCRSNLPLDWLQNFHNLTMHALDELFELVVKYCDRDKLRQLIDIRCHELSKKLGPFTKSELEVFDFWYVRAWYFFDDAHGPYWDWIKSDNDGIFILNAFSGRMNRREHWPTLTSEKVEAILDAYIEKWPKVDLPSSWGSSSPREEKAYRFLIEINGLLDKDSHERVIPVLERLIVDPRYVEFHDDYKSIKARQIRKKHLSDFEPPSAHGIVTFLDEDEVVTVEGLRELVISELQRYQVEITGSEYNIADKFYDAGNKKNENQCTEIIAERLNTRLGSHGISVTLEHQMKHSNRSDFTVAKIINAKRRLLVAEVKGQWHPDLYTAASEQLHEKYSIHPDAENQGIFLVIWFGSSERVAGRSKHGLQTASELKSAIEKELPDKLRGLVDVFVLDVSR